MLEFLILSLKPIYYHITSKNRSILLTPSPFTRQTKINKNKLGATQEKVSQLSFVVVC